MGKTGVIIAVLAVSLALAAAALYRPDIPYAELEAKYAVATSKYVDLPGRMRMHYRDDGDPAGPVVMLVHGFGDSFLSWDGWIQRLSPEFRVITIDLPGHGLTRAPAGYRPSHELRGRYTYIASMLPFGVTPADRLGRLNPGSNYGGSNYGDTILISPSCFPLERPQRDIGIVSPRFSPAILKFRIWRNRPALADQIWRPGPLMLL